MAKMKIILKYHKKSQCLVSAAIICHFRFSKFINVIVSGQNIFMSPTSYEVVYIYVCIYIYVYVYMYVYKWTLKCGMYHYHLYIKIALKLFTVVFVLCTILLLLIEQVLIEL